MPEVCQRYASGKRWQRQDTPAAYPKRTASYPDLSPCLPYLTAFPCLQDVGGPPTSWTYPRLGWKRPPLGVTHALSRGSGRNRKDRRRRRKKKLFFFFYFCLPHASPAAPPPRFFPRLSSAHPHAYFGPSGIGPSPEISRRAAASVRLALPPRHVRPSALTPTFISCRRAAGPAALLHARAISSTQRAQRHFPHWGFVRLTMEEALLLYYVYGHSHSHSHSHEQARVRLEAPSPTRIWVLQAIRIEAFASLNANFGKASQIASQKSASHFPNAGFPGGFPSGWLFSVSAISQNCAKMSFRINGCVTTMREARVCQGMPGHTLALPAARQLPLPCCHISYIKDWLASGKVLVLGFNLVHIHLYQLSSYTDS